MTTAPNHKPHHHGDLRSALVQAGIELLAEGGKASLTLRKCAARAGVSHAAPAHHFNGLGGLRAAIAKEGFRLFRLSMLAACDDDNPSDLDRLKGICRGYLCFAIENPALFDLIFSAGPMADFQEDLGQTAPIAYEVLRDACAPFVPHGQDPVVIETQVWSLIHGYTHLFMAGRFGPIDSAQQDKGPLDMVMTMLDSLAIPQPKA